ncbi:MAG: Gfo/Idh/MocA family protein [Solirubrobacteraceae bacterium]
MAAERIRIGVVGCGLISQVMHLPYLSELADRFELVAVCDVAPEVVGGCAERYGVSRVFTRWEELIAEPIDAVLVATSGDHAPIVIAAARAGRHVMVEKPVALCSRDAEVVLEAGRDAGVCVLVGTMKRYDPAYERLAELLPDMDDLRLIRVTTLESPIPPHVAHYPLIERDGRAEYLTPEIEQAEQAALEAALGDAVERTRWCYRRIVVQTLVHEFNMRFGEAECHLSWVSLPGIARYRQELAFYSPDQRLTLELPSPFLRSMPSRLIVEGGDAGTAHSWQRDEVVSYEEAFKRELIEFADCIVTGREPRTSAADGLRDVRLAEAVARADAAVS